MKKEHNRIHLAICLFALCALTAGAVLGKYIFSDKDDYTVTFTAKLAEELVLQEHVAEQQADGSYELVTETVTAAQIYNLIPGLDIPKDPHVVIKGKSNIPAYLFIKVDGEPENTALHYAVDDTLWEETTMLNSMGLGAGKVYVYGTNANPTELVSNSTGEDIVVSILKDNEITVGQELLHGANANTLVFHAYLIQTTAFTTAG